MNKSAFNRVFPIRVPLQTLYLNSRFGYCIPHVPDSLCIVKSPDSGFRYLSSYVPRKYGGAGSEMQTYRQYLRPFTFIKSSGAPYVSPSPREPSARSSPIPARYAVIHTASTIAPAFPNVRLRPCNLDSGIFPFPIGSIATAMIVPMEMVSSPSSLQRWFALVIASSSVILQSEPNANIVSYSGPSPLVTLNAPSGTDVDQLASLLVSRSTSGIFSVYPSISLPPSKFLASSCLRCQLRMCEMGYKNVGSFYLAF